MNVYELQRQENIRRNQSLLKELHLDSVVTPTVKRARPDNDKAGTKRRKLETLPPPTRSSARLSAAPKPNYTDTPNSTPPQRSTGPQKRRTTAHDPTASPPPDADASEAPPADLEAITQGWHWHATAPPPTRDETTGALHFADFADFAPNKTPAEILREGCFGGCYFRPVRSRKLGVVVEGDWEELPEEWTRGLDVGRYLTGEKNEGRYDPEVNKYKVACGQSIEEWEAAGKFSLCWDCALGVWMVWSVLMRCRLDRSSLRSARLVPVVYQVLPGEEV